MTAPAGVVDLSLPDYPTLVARAGVDPRAEAARVAAADPATVAGTGGLLGRAGGEMDASYTRSLGAADALGRAFTNDGAPVLDRATHVANLPQGFGDAGARLAGTSRRVGAVADDLSATMRLTAGAVTGMDGDLSATASAWSSRVAAAGTAGGLIPQEAVPALLAERDRIATQMAGTVAAAGRRVVDRIRGYEVVVNEALRLLADHGFVPAAELDAPPPPPPVRGDGADPAGLGTPLMAGYAADPVNTALGNFVEVETDLPFGGLLAGLTVARTYNSRSDRSGPFGARWASWATARLVERTWTAEFEGPDGQRVAFPRIGARFGRAVGVDGLVERSDTGLVLAWFDGRRWEFDPAGRPARTWGGPGTAVRFVHEDDRLVALVHEGGRRVTLQWDGDRIVAVGGSDGRRVDYRHAGGELVEADGPRGARRYDLDPGGRVASVTDADGVVELVNTYDEQGRVLTQRSPFGRLVTFAYAADGSTVVADDSAGPTNVYRNDAAGRLVAVTDGHGHTLRRSYDAWGRPVEIVERGGGVVRQEFDDRGHLVRRTTPSGAVCTLKWDDADRVVAISAAGATTRFTYTGAERIPSEIVDPEGGATRLEVGGGLVTAVTDPDGVTVRLCHDPDGHLVEAVDAAGGVARIERDAAGLPSAVVTPAGRRTELVHDEHGRLVARRDPAGGVWRHEYSRAGRRTAVVDPTGARIGTTYGPHGAAAELVDALGAVTTLGYDVFGNLADRAEPDHRGPGGAKWAFRHDALSRLTAWTDPAGGTWWQDHDVDGRPTGSTDPAGVRTHVGYDQAGRPATVDDGLVVTGTEYDELDRPVAQHRADGTTRSLAYDRCGRLVAEIGPDGGETRYTYSPAGRLTGVVAPSGREERRIHDACGRLAAVVDGNGQRFELRHDPDGLLVERISPAGLVETLDRDACGRITRHRVPGRGTTAVTYDLAGRVVALADRAGRRAFTRDAAGRVTAVTDALGHTTRYDYSLRGDLVAVTDPLGHVTRHEHDPLGRITATTDPLGRTTRFAHDAAGRLRERIEPTGLRQRWTYDASGRPRSVTAGTDDERTITVERDALARPVRITETATPARTDRANAALGRPDLPNAAFARSGRRAEPIELRRDAAGRLVERRCGDRVVAWSYDLDGLRTALTHPDGSVTSYRRDGAGRVVGLDHPLLGPVDLQRDPDGRLLALTGAGLRARWSYTEGWLTGCEWGEGSTWLVRDDQGRVVATDGDNRRRFGYDPAGQLVTAADTAGERTYTYDAAGRLVGESGPDGPRRHAYDAAAQLTSSTGPDGTRSYGYDEAGRRVAEEGRQHRRTYGWDGFGRLTGIDTTAGGVTRSTSLHVDALGELVQVDDVALAWDTADPGAPLVGLGDRAVVGLGHPWAVANDPLDLDWQRSAGSVQHPWGHDPWGHGGSGSGLGPGYRGELVVDGLTWLRERAYDPATRAFLAPDPLPAVPGTAHAANPYHYAGNDPVNNVDPLGLRPVTDAELGEHDSGGGLFSKIGHGVLDVAGLVPGVGEVADLANAAWYTAEGDYTMAALSAAAAIPFAGWAATGTKAAIKGAHALDAATSVGRLADGAATVGRRGDDVLFGQRRVGEAFGAGGGRPAHLDGRLISDVAGDLKSGRLGSDDIPVDVFRDPGSGALVSANTRSLAALSEAGLRPTNITHVEPTPKLLERLQEAPVVPGGTLPGREVAVTPSQRDLTIQRIIRIPD